uniref:LicD family protein n=1 Tax=Candidatus Kentrum sp. FW TaxID=2126338 RepID=A0A450TDA7_9GAMM|nr:MAG: LicD family protein [Candidatus Kentron sp. FW]
MVIVISGIILLTALFIRIYPFTFKRAKSGMTYRVLDKTHTLPELDAKIYPFMLKKRTLDNMAMVLERVVTIFREHEIEYFLHAGSLLGAARHGGFIPWDDDIDMMVDIRYEERILQLTNRFRREGLYLSPARGGYKVGKKNILTAYPYVDLIMAAEKNGAMRPCLPRDKEGNFTYQVSQSCPREYYELSAAFPLRDHEFEHLRVKVPNNIHLHVEQIYGPNALNEIELGSRFYWLVRNQYLDNIAYHLGLIEG